MAAAFEAARQSLSSTAVLEHPVAVAELSLVTDASATHAGAVIQQKRLGKGWRLLGFFSAQVNYNTFDREILPWLRQLITFAKCSRGGVTPFSRIMSHW
jgi:hypothetical protein